METYTVIVLVCLALCDLGHASTLPTESPGNPKTTVPTTTLETQLSNTTEGMQTERQELLTGLPPSSDGNDNETLASHTKHEHISTTPFQKPDDWLDSIHHGSTKSQNKDPNTSPQTSNSISEYVRSTTPTHMKPEDVVNWSGSIHPIQPQGAGQTVSNTEGIVKDVTTAQSKIGTDDSSITFPTSTTPISVSGHSTTGVVVPMARRTEHIVKTFRTSPVPESEITKPVDENTRTDDRDPEIQHWLDLIHSVRKTKDDKNGADHPLKILQRTPDLLPPDKFMKWLNGIHSKSYMEKNENHVEISDHSMERLHDTISITTIAIVSAVGSAVLIVLLVISTALWRRTNSRKDVVEVPGTTVDGPYKPKVGCVRDLPHDGYHDVFMGIPSNTDIWKELQCLPKTASSVMPES